MTCHDFKFEWDDEITDDVIKDLHDCLERNKTASEANGGKGYSDIAYTPQSAGDGILINIGMYIDRIVFDRISCNEQTVRLWAYNADHPEQAGKLLIGVLKKMDLYKPIREE